MKEVLAVWPGGPGSGSRGLDSDLRDYSVETVDEVATSHGYSAYFVLRRASHVTLFLQPELPLPSTLVMHKYCARPACMQMSRSSRNPVALLACVFAALVGFTGLCRPSAPY
jgi:hypothetical protein